ncbi:MAG: septum formation inhibitor Maf [Gammaproteobacteria bacterium]|nr:septum formation inhibitor Maf [Gammaproteobacteria bacterium]
MIEPVLLASTSPRRRELLAQIGVPFEVVAVEVDEGLRADEAPEDYVVRLALEKARAGAAAAGRPDARLALGADTVVVLDGDVLLKPSGRAEALAMLARLSGRTHRVLSGVAVAGRRELTRLSESRVTFRTIDAREREAYWETGEPADKAGAYAIQGVGAVFVTRLEGSYSGVVGLPLGETAEMLALCGVDICRLRAG